MEKYYPNPIFKRSKWISLNGTWEFDFDDADEGVSQKWQDKKLTRSINVPFVYQCEQSGINDKSYHPIIWYRKTVELEKLENTEAFLSFNAVDYKTTVFINGQAVCTHEGGYTPFSVSMSSYVHEGENTIALRVEDYHDDSQPRGKQIWTDEPWGCWYTASSGIWKDVWIFFTGKNYIENCRITPDLDNRIALFEIDYPNKFCGKGRIKIELSYKGEHVTTITVETEQYRQTIPIHITQPNSVDDVHAWSPDSPSLYEVTMSLYDANEVLQDEVHTHFGMRKISIRNGQMLLNNRPLYQRLILDQGYWPESLLTPPDKNALQKDLQLVLDMGFNGIRKHQKFEDPWFYYLADKMGVIVWAELPSPYKFSTDEIQNVQRDMSEGIKHLYNHPSIVTWVPFNESWGVRDILNDRQQQNFVKGIYYLIKSLDPSRLVSANDGWEMPIQDFIAIHDYDIHDAESYEYKWDDFDLLMKTAASKRQILTEGNSWNGEPVLLTEFGGIALQESIDEKTWGYRSPAKNAEELLVRLRRIMDVIYSDKRLYGFCYTQLTDVMQEVNGLLTPDRKPKCPIAEFKKIFMCK